MPESRRKRCYAEIDAIRTHVNIGRKHVLRRTFLRRLDLWKSDFFESHCIDLHLGRVAHLVK
jgi:hypothetical protein